MEIVANDGSPGDQFGRSVAISGDYAIVGAPNNTVNDKNSGSAYIFKRTDGTWSQMQVLVAEDAARNDKFGWSVSISGNYAIVGAYQGICDNILSGSAYIFKHTDNTWSQIQKIKASNGETSDQFGYAVSISGDYAIVGAPFQGNDSYYRRGQIYIFKLVNKSWMQIKSYQGTAKYDNLGIAVDINENFAVAGIPNYDNGSNYPNTGLASLFVNQEDNWSRTNFRYTDASNIQFGYSLSISENYAIIGCGNHNYLFIFEYIGNSLRAKQQINCSVYSVSISNEHAMIGGNSIAYIYKNKESSWHKITTFGILDNDTNFGHSVNISNDTYIIGAYSKNGQQGAAYINQINQFRDCQLTGYVSDINKNPIEGISINSTLYGTTTTDNKGYYSLNGSCLPSDQLCLYDQISLTKGTITYYNSEECYWGRKSQNFTIQSYTISGYIKNSANHPIQGVTILFSNEGGETITDENGFYRHTVYQGWNGKASAIGQGYQFEPFNLSYSNIKENQTDQNYTGKKINISGYVFDPNHQPIKDVQLTFTNPDRTIKTDANGFYNLVLDYQWTGSVTPQKIGFNFQPEKYDYYKIFTSRAYINYTALEQTSEISGQLLDENNQPISGIKLYDNADNYIQTDSNGKYTYIAGFRWTGYLKPVSDEYTFSPKYYAYDGITHGQSNQDFKGHINKYLIAGIVLHKLSNTPLEGVQMNCQTHDCETATDRYGQFKLEVPYAWSDTLTIQKTAYVFEPQQLSYQNVNSDIISEIVYYQETQFDISGKLTDTNNQPLSNVTIYFNNK